MKLECQNCGMVGDEEEFPEAKDLTERHTMGDAFSDQECPDCGALAFPVVTDANKQLNRIRAIIGVDDELEYTITTLEAAFEFAKLIARLKTEQEFIDEGGEVEDDDSIQALDELIASAREITGKKGGES